MTTQQIVFTGKNRAELLPETLRSLQPEEVLVKTSFSTVSCGTERANIMGNPNIAGGEKAEALNTDTYFPRTLGYSSAGIVVQTGTAVTSVIPGDRVVVFWGKHASYNLINESNAVKITDDRISLEEAAISFIASFSLAGIRKTRLEAGESTLVMGLGLLGQLAVQLARASGAVPVIAADPIEERRLAALKAGADFALDPFKNDFSAKVKELTGGGVNTAIEVTGQGAGLEEVLDCMAKFGRVALLGCTRDPNFIIDYYRKVHFPGISLIGAHTMARPEIESRPGCFTHHDDILSILKLCAGGRIHLKSTATYSPAECSAVYTRLVEDKDFPVIVQFDWSKLE